MPPAKPCSSRSRSKIRLAVCCCFLGRDLSSPRNALDHCNKWIKLRLRRRLLAHITRWHRELHHLVHGPWIDPEPAGRRTLAQALNANRMPRLQIEIHALHPPPPADSKQKAICCRSFTPALPEDPAASMRDYCSGAYITPGAGAS